MSSVTKSELGDTAKYFTSQFGDSVEYQNLPVKLLDHFCRFYNLSLHFLTCSIF